MRRKFWRRWLGATIAPYLIERVIRLLWKTCRIRQVVGAEHIDALLSNDQTFIPCYWHQRQLFCLRYLLTLRGRGLNLGYLISPSADGDMAARMFTDLGLHIIRGSATRSGAQALRDIYTVIKHQHVSPIITPDGPTGPIYEFKHGVAMLSQLSGAPLVPITYSADRYWQLRSWDRFIVPRPFANIVIGVGAPVVLERRMSVDQLPDVCNDMTGRMNELVARIDTAAQKTDHSQ